MPVARRCRKPPAPASRNARARRIAGARAAVPVLLLLLAGCGPSLLFVGDPVLEATLFDRDQFEQRIERAASQAGYRASVHWPSGGTPAAAGVHQVIGAHGSQVVVLSPYLSLFAAEIVERFPDRRFVGYYGREPIENLTWVHFDAEPALREAGRVLAEWVFATTGRTAVLVTDGSDPVTRAEGEAIVAGYESVAEVGLEQVVFDSTPVREEVRSRVRAAARDGERVLVVLLGAATGWALEAIRDDDVVVAYRHGALPDTPGPVLFTIRDDLAAGLSDALTASTGRVVTPSRIER